MRKILLKLIKALHFKGAIDFAFSILAAPAALLLLAYRKVGPRAFPRTTRLLRKIGVFPIRKHYYEPLFDDTVLKKPLSAPRRLPGLDLNVEGQLEFLKKLVYAEELVELTLDRKTPQNNHFDINFSGFASGDAEYLYQLIRAVRPAKIVEIGSGFSTKIMNLALRKNLAETGKSARLVCVEPYENPWLEKFEGIKLIRERVEDLDFDWSNELSAGDIVFIDSSHVIRPQGDVLKEYLEILPLLPAGVYVHIHDIFTPRDYLDEWVRRDVKFWNEQYLLEALLSNTNRYEVVGALNYLKNDHYEKLKPICPYLSETREPGSFYIRVKP